MTNQKISLIAIIAATSLCATQKMVGFALEMINRTEDRVAVKLVYRICGDYTQIVEPGADSRIDTPTTKKPCYLKEVMVYQKLEQDERPVAGRSLRVGRMERKNLSHFENNRIEITISGANQEKYELKNEE